MDRKRLILLAVLFLPDELMPAFLKTSAVDFIDGKPFRYQHQNNASTLYSIGFDGIDDGGKSPSSRDRFSRQRLSVAPTHSDVVWTQSALVLLLLAIQDLQKRLR